MSHFTTIKIQIKDGEILNEVLQELGYEVVCNTAVRGYQGKTTEAEYVIRRNNGYDIGFRREGETYEAVADFWGADLDRDEFIDSIAQKYARKTLISSVRKEGFDLEEEEILEDGTLRIVVGKWV